LQKLAVRWKAVMPSRALPAGKEFLPVTGLARSEMIGQGEMGGQGIVQIAKWIGWQANRGEKIPHFRQFGSAQWFGAPLANG
jgi:hypothetical protein